MEGDIFFLREKPWGRGWGDGGNRTWQDSGNASLKTLFLTIGDFLFKI